RTRTGVVLLAIGVLVALVPVIGIVGSLLSLAGAILVILGRKAFGARHARNVVLAIVLFLVGFVGGFLLTLGVFASIGTAILASPSQIQAAVTNAFSNLLVGAIVIGLISGLASVLFLWELLSTSGRILVLASYAVSVGMDVAIYLFVMGRLGPALAAASGSPPDLTPLLALDLQLVNLRLLDVFPTVLLAAAAYVAWSRIKSGEIPKKGTGASRASAE
ncbi:MAG TPA: hypothetical protein VEY12_03380, partial [Thermoplasmata archaeon]|nr:hypothetical protein [Thermoplasmata archaeon]